jgi:hypothetical protein
MKPKDVLAKLVSKNQFHWNLTIKYYASQKNYLSIFLVTY